MNRNKIVIERKVASYNEAAQAISEFLKDDLHLNNVFTDIWTIRDWCLQQSKSGIEYMNQNEIIRRAWLDCYVGTAGAYYGIRVSKCEFADINQEFYSIN